MAQLAPIRLQDGTMIYIEAGDEVTTLAGVAGEFSTEVNTEAGDEALLPAESAEPTRGSGGGASKGVNWTSSHQTAPRRAATQRMADLETTIRAYTRYTLDAFREVGSANIEKVTLEFGVKVSGEAGIPYITKGSAEGNLRITVECSFPCESNLHSPESTR